MVPLPGASAVLAAVAGSGVAGPRWAFEGFLPRSGRERRERLARIAADERGTVLFEAPTRVTATLRDLAAACGPERRGAVCRELTKVHESFVRGTLGELAEAAASGQIPMRGEFVLVVGPDDGRRESAASAADEAATLEAARGGGRTTRGRGDGPRRGRPARGRGHRHRRGVGCTARRPAAERQKAEADRSCQVRNANERACRLIGSCGSSDLSVR